MAEQGFSAELQALRKRLAVIFAAAALCILAGGLAYHHSYQKTVQRDAADLLSSIKKFKTDQILFWRADRFNDTNSLLDTPVLSRVLNAYAADNYDAASRDQLTIRLTSYLRHNKYRSALLAKPDGAVLTGSGENARSLPPEAKALIKKAIASGRTEVGDFYVGPSGRPRIDIVSRAAEAPGGRRLYLVLEIAPDDYLYPLLQIWPTNSRTGETVLARADGRDILFLGDLRKISDAGMKLRLPRAGSRLPIARALNGEEGTVLAEDYNGDKVMAAIGMIPGTNWGLVVKMDWDEVAAGTGRFSALILLLTFTLLGGAGGWAYLLFRLEAERYTRELAVVETEKDRYRDSFRMLADRANDMFLLSDPVNRSLLMVNRKTWETYGYTEEEMLRLHPEDMIPPEDLPAFNARFSSLADGRTAVYEVVHMKKDGTRFPLEVSATGVRQDGKNLVFFICRDITERRLAESRLRERERLLNESQSIARLGSYVMDIPGDSVTSSPALDEMLGWEAPVSRRAIAAWSAVVHPVDREAMEAYFNDEVLGRGRNFDREYRIQRPRDGAVLWVHGIGHLEFDKTGAPAKMHGTIQDITGQKEAALQLQKLNLEQKKNLRLYTLLAQINEAAAQTKDARKLFCRLCEVAVGPAGGFRMAWVGYPDRDTGRLLPLCSAGAVDGYLDHIKISATEGDASKGPSGSAARSGAVRVCQDIAGDPAMAPWREACVRRGYRSSAAVPLYDGSELAAVLNLYSAEKGFFTEEEVKLLSEVKDDVSLALEAISAGEKHGTAQNALERTATQLTHLMEAMPVVLFTLKSLNGRPIPQWVSGNSESVTGYEPMEMLSPEWFDRAVHPEDRAWVLAEQGKVFEKGEVSHDFRLGRKDGSYAWMHAQLKVGQEKDEVIGSFTDITPLKESELRFRKLFERAPLANRPPEQAGRDEIYIADPETGRMTYASLGALKNLGYTRAEIEQKMVWELVEGLTSEALMASLVPLKRKEKQLLVLESEHRRKDGSAYPVQSRIQIIDGAAGPILLLVATEIVQGH